MKKFNHTYNDGDIVVDVKHKEIFRFSDAADGYKAETAPEQLRPATSEEIAILEASGNNHTPLGGEPEVDPAPLFAVGDRVQCGAKGEGNVLPTEGLNPWFRVKFDTDPDVYLFRDNGDFYDGCSDQWVLKKIAAPATEQPDINRQTLDNAIEQMKNAPLIYHPFDISEAEKLRRTCWIQAFVAGCQMNYVDDERAFADDVLTAYDERFSQKPSYTIQNT